MSELRGQRVVLVPLVADHFEALREIRREPAVERFWGVLENGFPDEDEPDCVRFAVLVSGDVVGMVQFSEEPEPDYRHAELDIFLASTVHGQGLGREVLELMISFLQRERGHHRIVIGADVDNAKAQRCYTKAGFREIGRTEKSWLGPDGVWHDEVLMELVVDPASVASPANGGG